MSLEGSTVLITGGARRIGAALALHLARAGADIILHHGHSGEAAEETATAVRSLGRQAWVFQADLNDPQQTSTLASKAWQTRSFQGLINNAAIFEPLDWQSTTLEDWQRTLTINLTVPFLLSQQFARLLAGSPGRIINILDWRALRPQADHLAYTTSKAALAALTKSLAIALAPAITVNGLALGAILPPADVEADSDLLKKIPAGRWGELSEVGHAAEFLLSGPDYITGQIIHIDGGRHLI